MFCSLLTNSRIDAAECLDDLPRDPPGIWRGEERDNSNSLTDRAICPDRTRRMP